MGTADIQAKESAVKEKNAELTETQKKKAEISTKLDMVGQTKDQIQRKIDQMKEQKRTAETKKEDARDNVTSRREKVKDAGKAVNTKFDERTELHSKKCQGEVKVHRSDLQMRSKTSDLRSNHAKHGAAKRTEDSMREHHRES